MEPAIFKIMSEGHLRDALLVLTGRAIVTEDVLENMTNEGIEEVVNEHFICYEAGDNWLLVPKDYLAEFIMKTDFICK